MYFCMLCYIILECDILSDVLLIKHIGQLTCFWINSIVLIDNECINFTKRKLIEDSLQYTYIYIHIFAE